MSTISSVVTILLFLSNTSGLGSVKLAAVAMILVFAVAVTGMDGWHTFKHHARRFKPASPKIKAYLIDLINSGGRTAIVSRNLSWVDDEETKTLLRGKAQAGDLALYLPEETDFTRELARLGASVHPYGGTVATRSRFTIVNHGRGDARVAVGASVDGMHFIGEYGAGDPVLVMAEDLLTRLARD